MGVRALYLSALVLAVVLVVIIALFGAIVAFAYRRRRPGLGYFACANVTDEEDF
jgi:hypothetical protein